MKKRAYVLLLPKFQVSLQIRPYKHDSTASRLLSEVKHVLVRLVLRWGTTLEHRMLNFFLFLFASLVLCVFSAVGVLFSSFFASPRFSSLPFPFLWGLLLLFFTAVQVRTEKDWCAFARSL